MSYQPGDRVIIWRSGRLYGKDGEIAEINYSEVDPQYNVLFIDTGEHRVPCFPSEVKVLT